MDDDNFPSTAFAKSTVLHLLVLTDQVLKLATKAPPDIETLMDLQDQLHDMLETLGHTFSDDD